MKNYASVYNDFTIVDGTHNTVMYDLKLLPFTNVDCLGKNIITGFVLDESENGGSVSEGLELINLARPGSVLMTDGGSAFPSAASNANMHHVLCSQHFQKEIFGSAGGLGERSDQFKRDANELIFSSFRSAQSWQAKNQAAKGAYYDKPKAMSCLQKIFHSKEKVCLTFTGAGHVVSAPH